MVIPGLLAILAPLVVGIVLGVEALGGLLAGALAAGVLLALMMANAGGAWDNAKKYVEEGNYGGKGSDTHAAAVIGDTVGDPFKDTSGPSINILIKLMTIVAVVFAPLFVSIGGLL
jgi:K(+)-stimulated pyrophosphate-energized sodium pump